jgi:GDP/UDP-N,N'-diacetylbacillosamine 2-epimerase (hydrolysing)
MTSSSDTAIAPLLEVVVTARPSWARVKHLVYSYGDLAGHDKVRLTLVGPAVSQRYGDISKKLPEWLKYDIVSALNESDSLDAVALSCVNGSTSLIHKWTRNRPDCVLVIADRTETLGVSLAASLMQIPLIHLQGGEVSGSIDDKVRDANSKLADFHLTTNEITALRLKGMGENLELIKVVGCPSIDIVADVLKQKSSLDEINSSELGGVGANFSLLLDFGIIMFHPDTLNQSENIEWAKHLIQFTQNSNINWIWFWPNPDHGSHEISHEIRKAREFGSLANIRFIVNLAPEEFVQLAVRAKTLVGNSSFGIREASFIGLPVINIGKRQSGRQKAANVLDIPKLLSFDELLAKVNQHVQKGTFTQSTLYGSGDSGRKAASEILGWNPSVKIR